MDKITEFREYLDNQNVAVVEASDLELSKQRSRLDSGPGPNSKQLVSLRTVQSVLTKSKGKNDQCLMGLAAASLYGHAIQHLVDQTVPITNNIFYWDQVLSSNFNLYLYGLQRLPQWVCGLKMPKFKSSSLVHVQPHQLLQLMNMPKSMIRDHVLYNKQQLNDRRNKAAERLGILVKESLNVRDTSKNLETVVSETIQVLSRTMLVHEEDCANCGQETVLLRIIDAFESDAKLGQSATEQFGRPNVLVRYWPLIAGVGLVGLDILGNWRAILDWLRTSVYDTMVSLWSNWIVDPLFKIYQTIRHDDSAQIALMTKQSLSADMQSLERMVVDFVRDSGAQMVTEQEIRNAVSQGDLSAVLEPYERQLQRPLSSLIKGELVRSLLIQVQKTKVDVEVAMDGIDKLLQSQQLVFGLVAALPSFAIVWYGGQWVVDKARIGGEGRKRRHKAGIQVLKERASCSLAQVTKILELAAADHHHNDNQELTNTELGLLLCETATLRQLGSQIFDYTPSSAQRFAQWCDDLNYLENPFKSAESLRTKIDRMWLIYGNMLA